MSNGVDVPILLSKYGATLNSDDVKILRKLQNCEKSNEYDLSRFSPIVWGPGGLKTYEKLKQLGPGLWNRPQPDDVLDLIDEILMYKSARLIPLDLHLDLDADVSNKFRNLTLYDPRFFLPLFNVLLASENIVNCKKFVQKNCLALCFSCLTCHDGQIRRSAYLILSKFSKYLAQSSAAFDEKAQLLYFLSIFRNSLNKSNIRLSSIIAIFLSKSSNLLFKPFDRMYSSIVSFLLLKPTIDLKNIPEFYKFFHSNGTEFAYERRWILQLLLDGLREPKDYRIYEKRYVFKLFLAFHNCSLCDVPCRDMIGKIIKKAVRMKVCCADVCFNHNLIGWISTSIDNRTNSEFASIVMMAEILLAVGETMNGEDKKSFKVFRNCWFSCFFTFLRVYDETKRANSEFVIDEDFLRRLFSFVNLILTDCSSFESALIKRFMVSLDKK